MNLTSLVRSFCLRHGSHLHVKRQTVGQEPLGLKDVSDRVFEYDRAGIPKICLRS